MVLVIDMGLASHSPAGGDGAGSSGRAKPSRPRRVAEDVGVPPGAFRDVAGFRMGLWSGVCALRVAVKARHWPGVKARRGPCGSRESRTAMVVAMVAIST